VPPSPTTSGSQQAGVHKVQSANPRQPRKSSRRTLRQFLSALLIVLLGIGWYFNALGEWLQSCAERALQKHDAHTALVWIQRATRCDPRDADLPMLAARAHLQLNLNSAAQRDLELATQLSPSAIALDALELTIATQRGDLKASEQLLDWQADNPLPNEAYEAIIRCCQINNRLDRASLILDQLAQSKHTLAMVSYQRGRNQEISEDFAGAAEHYAKSLELEPNSPRAAFRAATCLYQLREFERAEAMFRKAQVEPYRALAAIELANCLWELNKLHEASTAIAPTLALAPLTLQSLYLQMDEYVDVDRAGIVGARIADALGNAVQSVELLERVLAFNHRDFEARSLLIKNLRLVNRAAEADELAKIQSQMLANRQRCRELRMELEEYPQNVDKLCELAELYWYTESIAESQLVLNDIFELDPNCGRAQALLAKIISEQNNRLPPK
jgi:tetratricopeptide (TPR) repeat protein